MAEQINDKIAAAFVLYNPDESIIDNIKSCQDQVNKIYLIDNSEKKLNENLEKYFLSNNKINYTRLNQNLGIAEALNIAFEKANKDGFDFLLTLDQDSKVGYNMVAQLYEVISENDKIALVCPEHFDPSQHKEKQDGKVEDVSYVMTSGNLVRVSAAKEVGGFDSKLFIDHVDHEFCLRLNHHGYKIKKVLYAILYHKLGKSETKSFLGINFYPSNHSPVRIYYRTRNRLYVDQKYKKIFPDYVKKDFRHFMREFLDMIVCEKQRFQKIKMMIKGFVDFKKGKFGQYNVK